MLAGYDSYFNSQIIVMQWFVSFCFISCRENMGFILKGYP